MTRTQPEDEEPDGVDHDRNDRPEVTVAKQRVYELARELGLESKEVLARALELGLEVKTASSGLDEDGAPSSGSPSRRPIVRPAEAPGSAEPEATEARPDGSAEPNCGRRGSRRSRP